MGPRRVRLSLRGFSFAVGGCAFAGLGLDRIRRSDTLRSGAFVTLGVAVIGLGLAYLRLDDTLRGTAFITAGVAAAVVGVIAGRGSELLTKLRHRLRQLARDPAAATGANPPEKETA